ncbi:hypothetical protein B4N89_27450 [Embleya scabrispora]|uniref:Uncharacterized protein n=1 Tax=Embleya scabrispora TaxID=159449 RepID=A0A1T3P530_9ACTN|nr:hypothetical protein [Embleya scabrispora]OPC84164.1 hypothetical protein B4N89_27450 [Embleya scabrispora]
MTDQPSTEPLDLDAIRADLAVVTSRIQPDGIVEWFAAKARLATHVSALLAALADAERRVALAQRIAHRDDYDLDVDLPGVIGDGLCGIDWDGDDHPPQWLVDRVVGIVRPHLARATERAEWRGLAWRSARERAVRLRAGLAEARDAMDEASSALLRADAVVLDARACMQRRAADEVDARAEGRQLRAALAERDAEIERLRTTAVVIGPGLGALTADLAGRVAAEIGRRDEADADPGRGMPTRGDWRLARDRTRAAEHAAERLEAERDEAWADAARLRSAWRSAWRGRHELRAEHRDAVAVARWAVAENYALKRAVGWMRVTDKLPAAEPPLYPPIVEWVVQAHEPWSRYAAADGWVKDGAPYATREEAHARATRWRARPGSPAVRVLRVESTHWLDGPRAPESPADAPDPSNDSCPT